MTEDGKYWPVITDFTVTRDETKADLISELPETLEECREAEAVYKTTTDATDITTEPGIMFRGQEARPILIWHATWDHEKAKILPFIHSSPFDNQ